MGFFFHGFSINLLHVKGGYGYGVLRHFQQYFSYIVAVSFIAGENRSKINIDKSFTKLCKVIKKYVYKNNNLILLFSLMGEIAI
jgi:hypothetical protein